MKKYLQCKKIETAIRRAKTELSTKQVYENFGQKEVREIEDAFIDISDYGPVMNRRRSLLNEFDNWCMDFTN